MSLWNLICQAALLDMICEWLFPKKHEQRPDTDRNMYHGWTEYEDRIDNIDEPEDMQYLSENDEIPDDYDSDSLNDSPDLYDNSYDDW